MTRNGSLPISVVAQLEVVVTAKKRDQSSQDVPIAIAVFSAKGLNELGLTSPKDVIKFVSNFGAIGNGGCRASLGAQSWG